MNTNLLAVLKVKIMSNGEEVLNDAAVMGQFLAEQCAEEPKPEVLALIVCLAAGYHKELRAAFETERARVKQTLAMRLHSDEGLDLALCNATLDLLCAALFGEGVVPETPPVTGLADAEKEIKRLKNIIAERDKELMTETQKAAQSSENIEKIKKTAAKRKGWLIVVALALGGVWIFGMTKNDELQAAKNELYLNSTQIGALTKNYENSKKVWVMNVTDMKVGNATQNNQWITKPGVSLKASDVRYLKPVFIYSSPITSWMTFYVKIIEPSGNIVSGAESPAGFSYSTGFQVKQGKTLSFDPNGFGSSSGGSYSSGTYTIELWCEGFCLYSGEVTLN